MVYAPAAPTKRQAAGEVARRPGKSGTLEAMPGSVKVSTEAGWERIGLEITTSLQ